MFSAFTSQHQISKENNSPVEVPAFKETTNKVTTEDIAEEKQHFYYANPELLYKNGNIVLSKL